MNRLLRIWTSLSLVTALVIAAVVAMPVRGGAQGDAVVATPQSVAHGVATLPDEAIAWRVVSAVAGDRDSATATAGSLGFTLAGDGALLVEDPTTGTQDVLAPGAAAFVADGADQVVSALDGTATYDAIALVPAPAATDAGDGTLVLGGDGFASPGGNRALDLSRVVLVPGQTVTSPAPDSPTPALVLVTQGTVDIDYAGETITLSAGQAGVFDGELVFTSATGAAVAIATIGAEVPALDDSAPATSDVATAVPSTGATPAADAGSGDSGDGISGGGGDASAGALDISVLDCSDGTLLDTTSCAPLAGVTVTLVIDGVQAAYVSGDGGALPGIDVPAGSSVTISDVSGGPEGLELLNIPFAIPAFDGDIVVPIVFDAPAEGPVATDPTGATPVAGEPAGPVVSTLTIQALDCRDGDLATLEGCVAMPNATFSVTRGTETQSVETGFTTDANGFATFPAEDGAAVTATYAFGAPTGVAPNNDGQVLEPVAGDATLTFVFVDVNESNG